MKKTLDLNLFGLVVVVVVTLIFISINFIQCDNKSDNISMPRDNGKAYSFTCNYNDMCEEGEYDYDREHEDQPCSDCRLKDYSPLQLVPSPGLQIVGSNSDIGKVFQFKFENGYYMDTWASQKIAEEGTVSSPRADIGDIDKDGEKEIVAVVIYKYLPYSGWDQKILMYKNGSVGTPYYESEHFGYSSATYVNYAILADVNNDGMDELIFSKKRWVEIYIWNGFAFEKRWTSPRCAVFRVDVGDADNDDENELVLAMFEINAPIIWDFDGDFSGTDATAEPIDVLPPDKESVVIDNARPRDADNDGLQEIIAGGNNNRLMVWKYLWDENLGIYRYKSVFISQDLGGWTQRIDAADVNGNMNNEVIVGTAAPSGSESELYIFNLVLVDPDPDNHTYRLDLIDSIVLDWPVAELSVGDVDNDGKDEIIVDLYGEMTVYEYVGEKLEKTYTSVYGNKIKVK